jgi:hypothetical protein
MWVRTIGLYSEEVEGAAAKQGGATLIAKESRYMRSQLTGWATASPSLQ